MTVWKVTITYRAAEILASLLPGRQDHLSTEAKRAIIELFGEVVRTRNRITAQEEKDHDT
jgi:hypothetical protein